jgi:hypothetical protein
MQQDAKQTTPDDEHLPEFRAGCPLCEHSDPELDRELLLFAQLLFDSLLWKHTHSNEHSELPDVDSNHQSPTLKERSNKQSTKYE